MGCSRTDTLSSQLVVLEVCSKSHLTPQLLDITMMKRDVDFDMFVVYIAPRSNDSDSIVFLARHFYYLYKNSWYHKDSSLRFLPCSLCTNLALCKSPCNLPRNTESQSTNNVLPTGALVESASPVPATLAIVHSAALDKHSRVLGALTICGRSKFDQ